VDAVFDPEDADERSTHGGSTPRATPIRISHTVTVYHRFSFDKQVFEYKQDTPRRDIPHNIWCMLPFFVRLSVPDRRNGVPISYDPTGRGGRSDR